MAAHIGSGGSLDNNAALSGTNSSLNRADAVGNLPSSVLAVDAQGRTPSTTTMDDMSLTRKRGGAGAGGQNAGSDRGLAPSLGGPLDYAVSSPASMLSEALKESRSQEPSVPPTQEEAGGASAPPTSLPPSYNDSVTEDQPAPPAAMPQFSPSASQGGGPSQPTAQASRPSAAAEPGQSRSRRRVRAPVLDIPEKVNWLIHLAYVRKDYAECEKLIDSQLQATANNCEYALYVKGLVLRHRGEMDDALQFFQKAMHLNPHHKDNAKQVARSLYLMSRHRAAIAVYEQILAAGVKDWHILHNMGICYSFTEDLENARRCLEEALQVHKHDITYLQLGKVLLQQGKMDEAVASYETALTFSPESAEILTTLGLLFLENGDSRKAFDLFGTALTYDPTDAKAVMGAGSIIQQFEEFDVALIKYRVAAAKTPESAEMWNNIGMCFFGKGKLVAAVTCLKRAQYLAPSQWKICYNLGLVHLHTKQYVSAFHFMSAAVNFKPQFALSYMLLGAALMYLDDLPNAAKAFQKAVDLDGRNALIRLNYATLLYNMGDLAGAASQHSRFEACQKDSSAELEDMSAEIQALNDIILPAVQLGIDPATRRLTDLLENLHMERVEMQKDAAYGKDMVLAMQANDLNKQRELLAIPYHSSRLSKVVKSIWKDYQVNDVMPEKSYQKLMGHYFKAKKAELKQCKDRKLQELLVDLAKIEGDKNLPPRQAEVVKEFGIKAMTENAGDYLEACEQVEFALVDDQSNIAKEVFDVLAKDGNSISEDVFISKYLKAVVDVENSDERLSAKNQMLNSVKNQLNQKVATIVGSRFTDFLKA